MIKDEQQIEKNEKLINLLLYTGIFAAGISAIAYLVITYVIVSGFKSAIDQDKQLMFAALGALFGIMITGLLRNQGISFAKQLPECKEVMKEYHATLNKTKSIKKMRTIKFYMIYNTIKDTFTKAGTIAVTTYLILYIFTEGNGDYSLFMLAVSNICMFAGFGLIALAKTYNFYIEEHIPAIKEITIKMKEQNELIVTETTLTIDQMGLIPSEGEIQNERIY